MNFSKTGTNYRDLRPMTDIYIERERERDINRIFEVDEFEFYEVF